MGAKSDSMIGVGAVAGGLIVAAGSAGGLGSGLALAIEDVDIGVRLAGLAGALVGALTVVVVALLPDSAVDARGRKIAFGVAGATLLLGAFLPPVVSIGVTAAAIGWYYADRVVRRLPPDAPMSHRLKASLGSLGALIGVALVPAALLKVIGAHLAEGMAFHIVMLGFGVLVLANIMLRVGFRQTRNAYMAQRAAG